MLRDSKMTILFQPTWILLATLIAFTGCSAAVEIETTYEWKYIDYVWKSDSQKEKATSTGEYDHTKIITIDFHVSRDGRVFVTTPRYYDNPASLSTISNQTGDGGPLLQPYPNWEWHKRGFCNGITSVNRIFFDDCNRLWIVDSGKIGNQQICPAQILAFNPETDELLERVIIPDNLTHNSVNTSNGRLEVQQVETKGNSCEQTWVYIGDPEGYGLVIWNGTDIWRLENEVVYAPDPTATIFSVAGSNVTIELGVSSIVISPPGFIDEGYLLFKPLASQKGYAAKLEDLHNSKTENNLTYYKSNFTIPSQELARVYSKSGVLIGGFASQLVVACWNLQYPLETQYIGILYENEEALQFTTSARIIGGYLNDFNSEEYWLMTNRLPQFIQGTMNFTDTNFRILKDKLADLVNGTVCEPASHTTVPSIEDKFFFEFDD